MFGAEPDDDWLAPVLATAAIAQLVQGDHNIFENADNTLIDLRSFHQRQAPATSGASQSSLPT